MPAAADKIIENVIGVFGLPLGLGLNFVVDGREYLVPMAIALSFGTVASTLVVLLLIPALHEIWEDLRRVLGLRKRVIVRD